jgi:hypothetical protein
MSYRATARNGSVSHQRTAARDLDDPWRTSLVRVGAGVAAGSAKRGNGNARSESWTMFMTREQFDACCAEDPLRFTDPLLFAQFKTEFEHVFNEPSGRASRS